jgi:hypothetical protein
MENEELDILEECDDTEERTNNEELISDINVENYNDLISGNIEEEDTYSDLVDDDCTDANERSLDE